MFFYFTSMPETWSVRCIVPGRNVGFEDSRHGFGIYWDAMELCM